MEVVIDETTKSDLDVHTVWGTNRGKGGGSENPFGDPNSTLSPGLRSAYQSIENIQNTKERVRKTSDGSRK
jgi:hypothetical protein